MRVRLLVTLLRLVRELQDALVRRPRARHHAHQVKLGEKPELEPSLRRRHNLGGVETRGGRSLFRGERGRRGRRERLGVWAHEPGK